MPTEETTVWSAIPAEIGVVANGAVQYSGRGEYFDDVWLVCNLLAGVLAKLVNLVLGQREPVLFADTVTQASPQLTDPLLLSSHTSFKLENIAFLIRVRKAGKGDGLRKTVTNPCHSGAM